MSETLLLRDIAAMSFEDALAELEQIVRRLEAGQVKLDEAILSYERGAQLKRHCERKLNEAQQRVERIVVGPDGAIAAEPAKLDLHLVAGRGRVPEALAQAASLTDLALDRLLAVPPDLEARVLEAMRYSALGPGKRLRPFLVLASARLFASPGAARCR